MADSATGSGKSYAIQCLRAFAALVVVADHCCRVMNTRSHFQIFAFGGHGVDVFFVISGFIMLFSTPASMTGASFMMRRLIRIVPLYWTMTILFSLAAILIPSIFRTAHPDIARFVKSLLFIPHYHATRPTEVLPILTPGWTLNFEMFFYLIFAFSMIVFRKWLSLAAPVIIVVAIVAGGLFAQTSATGRTYTNPIMMEFVFGIAIGACVLRGWQRGLWTLAVVFGVGALASFLMFDRLGLYARPLAWGGASAALVAVCLGLELRGVNFNRRVPLILGDASYSIYLVQIIVLGGIRAIGNALHLDWTNWGVDVATTLLALAAASATGILMFQLFEKQVGRALQKAMLHRPSAVPTPSAAVADGG